MTEAAAEATTISLTEVLVRHGIYQHNGITRIAIEDFTVQDLTGDNTFRVNPNEVALLEAPGSPAWVDRMVRVRNSVTRRLTTVENDLRDKTSHLERMGEAILEQAIEREWCEEYDAFAEEWGLPTRITEWEVTMTVRVKARNEDDAVEIVKDNVHLDSYSTEGVEQDPEFYASSH